jgi:acyl-CoA synthetase (AMP-forming)/AMP-acid ligase II
MDTPVEVRTLVELLEHRARCLGNKPAFEFIQAHDENNDGITYAQLHRRALSVAGQLQAKFGPGDRVWLLFPPGLEFISAFFGCLYAGIIAVPLCPPRVRRLTPSLEPVFSASRPAAVLTTSEHLNHAAGLYGDFQALLELPWVAVDQVSDDWAASWRDPEVNQRDVAFLQYTSGSTATPKGVMLSHHNLLHNSALISEVFGTDESSSAVFWLPLFHDMGLIGGVIQPIYCGGSCTLLAPAAFLQRPLLWLETISSRRASISGGPDFGYEICVRKISEAERAGLDLSSWRLAFTGAEPIRAGTLDRFVKVFSECGFRQQALLPVYGLAEATLMASGGPRGDAPVMLDVDAAELSEGRVLEVADTLASSRRLVGCGTALRGQQVVVVDPEKCHRCPGDRIGEIWIRGASVALGYFEQPVATQDTFGSFLADTGEGPFLRTGDLGFLHHGQLYVTGRLKDRIIIRGRNHYPQDIELTVESAFPGLRAGHVVAFAVEVDDQERLTVVQELEPRVRTLDWEAAFQAIRQAISTAHDLEVHSIVLTKAGALPKTTSGKRQRSACRDLLLKGQLETLARWTAERKNGHAYPLPLGTHPADGPRTAKEIENWLIHRIASQLGVPTSRIQVDTPFLDLGMGSLDAMEVAADLQQWLNRKLSPTAIYNYPNIKALSLWLVAPPSVHHSEPVAQTARMAEQFDPERTRREIQQLTEDEIADFLRQELARLHAPDVKA